MNKKGPGVFRTFGRSVAAGLLLLAAGEATHAQPSAVSCPTPSQWQRCKDRLEDCCLGYPSEFAAAPLGFTVAEHFQAQVSNGAAARMTLYDYDFCCGSDRLNYRGRKRLACIAPLLAHYPFPVLIEQDPRCPGLAEARRLEVLRELAAGPLPVPPERVVIGWPLSRPASGEESLLIHQTLLLQTSSAGFQPGTGSGPFGGAGTGAGFLPTPGFAPGGGSSSGTRGGR
jgi:hypothetical protein